MGSSPVIPASLGAKRLGRALVHTRRPPVQFQVLATTSWPVMRLWLARPTTTTTALPRLVTEPSSLCLLTGLTASAGCAFNLASTTAGTTLVVTLAAATQQLTTTSLSSAVSGAGLLADGSQRWAAAAVSLDTPAAATPLAWPEADLDTTTATDCEDLAVFAADVVEFVHQEVTLLSAVFGEGQGLLVAGTFA